MHGCIHPRAHTRARARARNSAVTIRFKPTQMQTVNTRISTTHCPLPVARCDKTQHLHCRTQSNTTAVCTVHGLTSINQPIPPFAAGWNRYWDLEIITCSIRGRTWAKLLKPGFWSACAGSTKLQLQLVSRSKLNYANSEPVKWGAETSESAPPFTMYWQSYYTTPNQEQYFQLTLSSNLGSTEPGERFQEAVNMDGEKTATLFSLTPNWYSVFHSIKNVGNEVIYCLLDTKHV
jgi:hypothetical protein